MKLFGTKRGAAHYQKKRGGRVRKVLLVLLILLLLLAGGAYAAFTLLVRPPDLPSVRPPRPGPSAEVDPRQEAVEPIELFDAERGQIFTVMIAGQDNIGEIGLTDTLMLALIDAENHRVNVVSIPRDTLVDVYWGMKVNEVFPMTGSVERLRDEVGRMIGFTPDFYITLNLRAFVELVDLLEGVWFNVPVYMRYDDPFDVPPLHIYLNAGYQQLTGAQALQLVRFRQNNDGSGYGDIGRMETQQDFLRAVAGELLQISSVTRIEQLARIFMENVDTDLPLGSLIWLATQLMGMDSEDINFVTMPGEIGVMLNGGSFIILHFDEWLDMVNDYLNPFPFPVTEDNVRVYAFEYGMAQLRGGDWSLTPDN